MVTFNDKKKLEDETTRARRGSDDIETEEKEAIGQRRAGNIDQRNRDRTQCKAAVVIEKNAARNQNPDCSVEKTASHRSQKPAILVELTKYTKDRVTERNRRQNKKALSRSLLRERS
ncbi:hypothetical protein HID58_044368 [Brassica napus]|uniref:Uncharacterized protein n=1 Tax=Brassica napus TaxID=3708 RepID=A0ABQ8BJ64_BRANA|nr:hypothetical protein HID58_044368 [Brassica napus]